MKKGTYIDYYVMMAALSSKRKKRQQHCIDALIEKACEGKPASNQFSKAPATDVCADELMPC